VLLAIDLGSTVTKAVLWGEDGPVGVGRVTLRTDRRAGGQAEQDPADWWRSVCESCRKAIAAAEKGTGKAAGREIRGVVFSAARQTFVLVDSAGVALRPGILWSDPRAVSEAARLAGRCGGTEAVQRLTGAILDSSSPAAKLAWLWDREPEVMGDARWMLSPRDFVVLAMSGEVACDPTIAQSSGLYDSSLQPVAELAGKSVHMLPPILGSSEVVGKVRSEVAGELGIPEGLPVVIGAGDRPCEVLGTGADPRCPMVSWGTTANVSVPVGEWPDVAGLGVVVSRGAAGGFLIEAGLSSAGSFLDWLASIGSGLAPSSGSGSSPVSAVPPDSYVPALLAKAVDSPPGANGLTAISWLGGARAPWWRDDVAAALVGISPEHTIGDMARAVVEAVAFEVDRCLQAVADVVGTRPESLALAAGSDMAPWPEVLTAVTGLPAWGRRSGLAAAAGAALIGRIAIGSETDGGSVPELDMRAALDQMDPPGKEIAADPSLVERYAAIRSTSDEVARAILGLADLRRDAGAASGGGGSGGLPR
jgi:xylulokinase